MDITYFTKFCMIPHLKVHVLIHGFIPPTFFKHIEVLVPEIVSYVEGLQSSTVSEIQVELH